MSAKIARYALLIALAVPIVGLGLYAALSGPYRTYSDSLLSRLTGGDTATTETRSSLAVCRNALRAFNTSNPAPVQYMVLCPNYGQTTIFRNAYTAIEFRLAQSPHQAHLHNGENWRTLFSCTVPPTPTPNDTLYILPVPSLRFEQLAVEYVMVELVRHDNSRFQYRGPLNDRQCR
jgi:hypothetical protein